MLHKDRTRAIRTRTWHIMFPLMAITLLTALLLVGIGSTVAWAQTPPPDDHGTPAAGDHTTPAANDHATPAAGTLPVTLPANGTLPDVNLAAAKLGDELVPELGPEEVAQLTEALKEGLNDPRLLALKPLAVKLIEQNVPPLYEKVHDKYIEKQNQRLTWVALVVVVAIPLIAFIGFMLYPLIARKRIQKRIPNASLGRFYRLYIVQAIVVTLVLFVLGIALWGVQFMTGRLGGITNPQLIIQRESINYVANNSEYLIDNYTDVFLAIARDIADDPEASIYAVILENARQLKEDPLVNLAANITNFVMPFLNYISLISFCLLVLFFLIRIAPDIKNMLTYPLDIIEAEENGVSLPQFIASSKTIPLPANSGNTTIWKVGRWMMWTEVKVIALFAVAVLAVALLMGFFLDLFFLPVVEMLVQSISLSAEYFLRYEGASGMLLMTTTVIMLFIIECVVIFLTTFIFMLMRLQEVLRQCFAKNITWGQAGMYMRGVGLRFGWVLLLAAILGTGLPFIVEKVDDYLYDPGKADVNWFLVLISTPLILLVGLNLVMWLARGFRSLINLFKKTAIKEFGLKPPKPKKVKEPVAAVK